MTRVMLPAWLLKLRDRLGLRPWRVRPGRTEPLRVPSADETRSSVRRFREAAERYLLLDFWSERFEGLPSNMRHRTARKGARSDPA
jgi:hypothetical protein